MASILTGAQEEKPALETAFTGWQIYPGNLNSHDDLALESDGYSAYLSSLASTIFDSDPHSTQVEIVDTLSKSSSTKSQGAV